MRLARALPLLFLIAWIAGCSWLGKRIRDENEYRVAATSDSAETRDLAADFSPIGLHIFVTPVEESERRKLYDYERDLIGKIKDKLAEVGFSIEETRLFVRDPEPKAFIQHKPWGEQTVRGALAEHPDWKGVAVLVIEETRGRRRLLQTPETLDVAGLHLGGIQPPMVVKGELGFFYRSPYRRGVLYAKWEKKVDGSFVVMVPEEARGKGAPFSDFSKVHVVRPGRDEHMAPPRFSAEELAMDLESQWRIAAFRIFAGDLFAHLSDRPLASPESRELGLESDIAPY